MLYLSKNILCFMVEVSVTRVCSPVHLQENGVCKPSEREMNRWRLIKEIL